jgi:folate-binding protein YgfZ
VNEQNAAKAASLETPLLETQRAAGAEFADYFGVRLPAQFGDPLPEYQAARGGVALIDTNFRSCFALTGPDRVRYLNAVTSGNIRDLAPGQSALGLLLNAQGHMLAELITLVLEDRLLVLSHAFVGQRTFELLDKFIIMDDATLTDETAQTGTLAIEGPKAPELLRELTRIEFAQLPSGAHVTTTVEFSGATIPCRIWLRSGRHSLFGFLGAELLLPRESLLAAWEALGAAVRAHGGAPIGYRALDMRRLEAGIPWFGTDFDEHQIPQEAGVESTHISFTKGCYTGQEIVERVRSRGHVNRRLAVLHFSSAEAPKPGTAIFAAAHETAKGPVTEAGRLTSAAFSPQAGKAIGMGYLRREFLQPGTTLQCGNTTAEVVESPLRATIASQTC